MTKFVTACVFVLAAGAALAHPGHGVETQSHWLTEPDHLAVLGLYALALGLGARRLWLKRRKADV